VYFPVKDLQNQTRMEELAINKGEVIHLINHNKIDDLKKIRNQFPEHVPLELLHEEVRESSELIDNYLKN
jgi:hypothetical protein